MLIHFPIDRVRPVGGPAGYLWNLNKGLKAIGADGYEFLPPANGQIEENRLLRKVIPNRVKDLRRVKKVLALPEQHKSAPVDYSKYEAIHFHSTEDLYLHRKALEAYEGEVVLTSHSPCVFHKELIGRLNRKDVQRFEKELSRLSVIDEYAFARADRIIFPCREAEEPYFNTWDGYLQVRDESKLSYLPTGIAPVEARTDRATIREKYGIPDDAFLMSYVGRHNSIKGYDILLEEIPVQLEDPNTWMIVAGKESSEFRPDHPRWIEVGWTDDPYSIVAAADVFILPNRQTYFDIVMLEVLSLGQIVVATRTGGNKYFSQFDSLGLLFFDIADGFGGDIERVRLMSEEERKDAREFNRKLYESHFTCDVFARNYLDLIRSQL